MSKDPILFLGGSSNIYSYCHGDAINCTDSSGLAEGLDEYFNFNGTINELGAHAVESITKAYTTVLGALGVGGTGMIATPEATAYCSTHMETCVEFASGVAGGVLEHQSPNSNTPSTTVSNYLGSLIGEQIIGPATDSLQCPSPIK